MENSPTRTDEQEARIARILIGAVDPHVHSGPSIAPRMVDHLELAKIYSDAGFIAAVTKDHDYAGVATAQLIASHYPDLKTKIFSGIVLNNVVGGLNPYAVEHTAAMGGKIVWLPTLAAENHLKWEKTGSWAHPASTQKMRSASPVPVLDEQNQVVDALKEILDIIAKNNMTLASGHIHVSETWIVFEEAKRRGVERLIFTHPEDVVGASLEDVQGIAAMGAYVEHSLAFFVKGSKFKTCTPDDMKSLVSAAGIDKTIICSDLGQVGVVDPLEGFKRGVSILMDLGYSDEDIHKMVATNAAAVLGLSG
ncbi:DUF6282 family protein [Brucella gallinifaecis]|uniref:Amidohydrolase-related domain-containing protein n=1 Tax=Brucella gallinifaecis TaxID=215590 RepID=A0A502BKW1_9HYPH|nr:DUF6282 family protein [Brucella gallinifaecis]TPF74684.1 hypothetical protein FHY56_13215 [Brucella gallinifaecis]